MVRVPIFEPRVGPWVPRWAYLAGIPVVVALAALGEWNPRDHVAVTVVLDHSVVAGVLVVGLAAGGLAPRREASFERARRVVGPLLVLLLAGGTLYVGDRITEPEVEAIAAVPGTDLEVSVRAVPLPFDERRTRYLFIDRGTGLGRRRVRVEAEARGADPPSELRASLRADDVVRVEWVDPWRSDPLVVRWDVTLDRDRLEVEGVEMTYCLDRPC